jgi:hypothetical protein
MNSPDSRKRMLSLGALVLPVIAVKLVTTILGHSAATSAQASPRPAAFEAATAGANAGRVALTSRQQAAAAYVRQTREQTFGRAPFLFEPKPPDSTSSTSTTTTPLVQDTQPDRPLPSFTLGAVMASENGQRALINGRPYLVGDQIKDTQWTILAIDIGARSVTLKDGESDRTIVIAVEKPL